MVYRPPEFEDKSKVEIPLWKKTLGWGPQGKCRRYLLLQIIGDYRAFGLSAIFAKWPYCTT
jgi:hypothetical protein